MSLRAAITAVLRGNSEDGYVHWLGVLCSSWVVTSRGSTKRSYILPEGLESLPSVELGNKMASRWGTS